MPVGCVSMRSAIMSECKKKKSNCGNGIAENDRGKKKWMPKSGEELKKNIMYYVHNIFTIFSQ